MGTSTPHINIINIIIIITTLTLSQQGHSLNITGILSQYPDLSTFNTLLTTTGISSSLLDRTSLTILAVPNSQLPSPLPPSSSLPSLLRSHILLQFLSFPDLRRLPPSGSLFPTLLQTTGLAPPSLSSLNLTFDPSSGIASFHPPSNSSFSSHVLSQLTSLPTSLSIFTVDSLLDPFSFILASSETRPPSPPINITNSLLAAHTFNVFSSLLSASGVVSEFEKAEGGAGITIFAPTDSAFSNLPSSINLQALPADHKSLVLKFHVLLSYYPLGSLESIVNPVQPTLATEDNGAGSFTMNISRVNGSVAINSGLVQAVVTQTVSDENPVAIFGVSNVLLPKEIFGKGGSEVSLRSGSGPLVGTQPPDIGPTPENTPDLGYDEPSHLSSPPGIASKGCRSRGDWVVVLACAGGLLMDLLL